MSMMTGATGYPRPGAAADGRYGSMTMSAGPKKRLGAEATLA